MKITRPRNNKKLLAAVAAVVILAAGAGAIYYYYASQQKEKVQTIELPKVDYSTPTNEQKSASSQAKKEFEDKQTEASQQQAAATGQTQTTTPTTVGVQVPTRSLTTSSTTVSSIISTIDNAGTCTLTLTKSGASKITASSSTQTMGSYSTCKDFGLNLTNTPKGDWQATLEYAGSAGQSGKVTKVITLE